MGGEGASAGQGGTLLGRAGAPAPDTTVGVSPARREIIGALQFWKRG